MIPSDYVKLAMQTASQYDGLMLPASSARLLNGVMGLAGEAGELTDYVKKFLFQGHKLDKDTVIEELGDCAWYLALICTAIDVSLEEVLQHNIDKLARRYPEGQFSSERSVNRDE